MDDDLSILSVSPSDRRNLERMGFTTLYQIALQSRYSLGLGKQRGDTLVQRARNILANRHIENIIVSENEVTVIVNSIDDAIIVSVKDILSADDDYLDINPSGKLIKITKKSHPPRDGMFGYGQETWENQANNAFNAVMKAANLLLNTINHKKKDHLAKYGIDKDSNQIISFAQERGFDGFWMNVFEEIRGNEIMKKCLAISLFSGFEEPVHTLIIGDPGSSKSLARDIIANNFKELSVVGANSTRSGLVCNLGNGQLGVLAYSDKKIVLVDEFDKIPESDVEYCYELLSNGKCSIHSAKIHQDILSNFAMIAFGNPKSQVFTKNPIEDIGLSPILMSRFALIVKTENLEKDDRLSLFRKKFYGKSELQKTPELYDQWIKLARMHKPNIVASDNKIESYLEYGDGIFQKYYATQLRRDIRLGDYLRRIPMAIAKANFSDITDSTIDKAENIIRESIESWK